MLKECKFCGQMVEVGERDCEGYTVCSCGAAIAETRTEEMIEEECQNIEILFGEDCGDYGFSTVHDAIVQILKMLAAMVARGMLGAVNLKVSGGGVAVIAVDAKGTVKVSRKVTQAHELKASILG